MDKTRVKVRVKFLSNMSLCNVVVVGDEGVGKSALVWRFTSGMFVEVNIKSSMSQTYSIHDFSRSFLFYKRLKTKKIILWEAEELSLKYVSSVTLVYSK